MPVTLEIGLAAMTLVVEYQLTSKFNAYYVATALLADPNKTVISTDQAYDRIPGLKRVNPREYARRLP